MMMIKMNNRKKMKWTLDAHHDDNDNVDGDDMCLSEIK